MVGMRRQMVTMMKMTTTIVVRMLMTRLIMMIIFYHTEIISNKVSYASQGWGLRLHIPCNPLLFNRGALQIE